MLANITAAFSRSCKFEHSHDEVLDLITLRLTEDKSDLEIVLNVHTATRIYEALQECLSHRENDNDN